MTQIARRFDQCLNRRLGVLDDLARLFEEDVAYLCLIVIQFSRRRRGRKWYRRSHGLWNFQWRTDWFS